MKPSVILHIGTEKTGTTTIQQFLKDNRSILASHDIYIPNTLGKINHQRFPFLAYSDDRHDDVTRRIDSSFEGQTSRAEQKEKIFSDLYQEICQASNKNWIISSEYLQSRLSTVEEIQRLKRLTDDLFSQVSILIYLRDPLKTAISMWSTAVKCGYSKFSLGKPGDCPHANHKKILERWLQVYNISQFKVRLFDNKKFKGGDLIHDFCEACNAINLNPIAKPSTANESLSYPSMILLSQIYEYLKTNKPKTAYSKIKSKPRLRRKLVQMVSNNCESTERYAPAEEEISEWAEYYEPSVKFLKANFFPDCDGPLWDIQTATKSKSSNIETALWPEETVRLVAESFAINLEK